MGNRRSASLDSLASVATRGFSAFGVSWDRGARHRANGRLSKDGGSLPVNCMNSAIEDTPFAHQVKRHEELSAVSLPENRSLGVVITVVEPVEQVAWCLSHLRPIYP